MPIVELKKEKVEEQVKRAKPPTATWCHSTRVDPSTQNASNMMNIGF